MVAKIFLWDTLVGAVWWNEETQTAVLEFAPEGIKSNLDVAPIIMPINNMLNGNRIFSFPGLNQETYKGLPGILADVLPDRFGNAVIDAWLARKGRSAADVNPVERLCFIGTRGMGALEFQPAAEPFMEESEILEMKELVNIASDLIHQKKKLKTNLKENRLQALRSMIQVGTSAGGARAKAIVAFNEKTGEVRSGQLPAGEDFEYWILKFDGIHDADLGNPAGYGRIEYAYYQMAVDCGIEMMESRLLEENDRAHFMTKRFDRVGSEKLHMQSLCGIAHFDFNMPGAYGYEQAFQIMRQLRLPYQAAEQMFLRMVFNVVARNQDDHTKNIAFLLNKKGEWKLAPAYDMNYAYNPEKGWTMRHQMSINGKTENIAVEDLMQVAISMNIKGAAKHIETIKNVVGDWKRYAKNASVKKEQIKEIAANHRL
ncbi:MAG: type II toxin-antitoxin system HipA family toxin [Bacteroidia bacterium]|nr:type II toxin-antitoxin system HipA family toxin [Bacteroidia bacterium]